MSVFYLTVGDTQPRIEATLKDAGTAINLTNAETVAFTLKRLRGDVVIDRAAASFTNKASGIVHYDWATGDVDEPGTYEATWTVFWGAGSTAAQTVPSHERDLVVITPALE